MALATKCPHCQTTFRVAHDQLKLRAGLVRCGACKEIFNGIEHLLRPAEQAALGTAAASGPPSQPPPAVVPAVPEHSAQALRASPSADLDPHVVATTSPDAGTQDSFANTAENTDVPDAAAQESAATAQLVPAATEPAAPDGRDEVVEAMHADEAAPQSDPSEAANQAHQPDAQPATAAVAPPVAERFADAADLYPAFDLITPTAPLDPHDHAASTDPLQRMTLMQITEEPDSLAPQQDEHLPAMQPQADAVSGADAGDASLAGHLHAASPGPAQPIAGLAAASNAPPDELDQAIAHLQRKPWRGSKKAARREQFESASEFDSDAEEPSFVTRARRRARDGGRASGWRGALIGLLLLGAALQAAYAFRDQLAAHIPALKPGLVSACNALGCRIDLPAQADAISIDSNDLTVLSAAKNSFSLTLLLRNRSTVAQRWPSIELTLLDGGERPIIRRVFSAAEYLPVPVAPGDGFAANSEQSARINFELRQQKAANYRVVAFYP